MKQATFTSTARSLALATLLALVFPMTASAQAGDRIQVPGDFATIQAAIDGAGDGQTIEVGPGIYNETLFVNKSLTLVAAAGPGLTLVHAGGASTAISIGTVEGDFDPDTGIHPDFVRIEGFHVLGWSERGIAQRLGSGTVEIIGNQLTATEGDTRSAIVISGGDDSRIEGNVILGTSFGESGLSSSGILTVGAMAASVRNNEVSGTDIGIALAAGFGQTDPSWAESAVIDLADNDIQATEVGIGIFGPVKDASLVGNHIANVTTRGITIEDFDGSGEFAERLSIINNQIIEFGTRAYTSSLRPVTGLELRDNLISSNSLNSWGFEIGTGTSDVLVSGNEINIAGVAIFLRPLTDALIEDNDLNGQIAAMGISSAGHADNLIRENRIRGGIIFQDQANIDGYTVTANQLLSTPGTFPLGINVAINADSSAGPLAATCNWWEDPSGPSLTAGGQGTSVSEHVNFEPWKTAPEGYCDGEAAFASSIAAASATILSITPDTHVPSQSLPTVLVLDQYGNPFANVQVSFELQASTGSIGGAVQLSDSDGLAQLGSWMLGDEPTQTVIATANDLDGSPISFTVNTDAIFHDRFESE